MRNYVQPGDSLALAVPYAGGVTSGQGVLVGALFGVAAVDAAQNALVECETRGEFELAREPALAITAGARCDVEDYLARSCGIGREVTLWLTQRGVRICGADAWSWDAPFLHTARRYAETRDAALIWGGHRAGMVSASCRIEKLANLEQLPPTGFQVACFPFKNRGASAGFTRAVAIFEE